MREPADPVRESPPDAVREASNGAQFWRTLPRNLAVSAAVGGLLAFVGALGTDTMPLPRRLLYWVPMMVVGALIGGGVSVLAARIPAARQNLWLLGAVISLGVAMISAAVIWFYTRLLWGPGALPVAGLPFFLLSVLVLSIAMTALMIVINVPGAQTHAAPEGRPVRFLERLPPKLKGAALYAVEAEDHYLRLHTAKGQDLILMRLADAIAELEGLEGAQTHRSWWVAKEAVDGVERQGSRVALKLKGGAVAPVSRPNVRALKAAGWF